MFLFSKEDQKQVQEHLGNRSIVYDPTDPDGKDIVNRVKGREWFRPFAASVMQEHAKEWFDLRGMEETPFMMYAIELQDAHIGEDKCCHSC